MSMKLSIKEHILYHYDGNKSDFCRKNNITRATLYRWIKSDHFIIDNKLYKKTLDVKKNGH